MKKILHFFKKGQHANEIADRPNFKANRIRSSLYLLRSPKKLPAAIKKGPRQLSIVAILKRRKADKQVLPPQGADSLRTAFDGTDQNCQNLNGQGPSCRAALHIACGRHRVKSTAGHETKSHTCKHRQPHPAKVLPSAWRHLKERPVVQPGGTETIPRAFKSANPPAPGHRPSMGLLARGGS